MKYIVIILFIFSIYQITADTIIVGKNAGITDIQGAVDSSKNGDKIIIKEGDYITGSSINISSKKDIEITGEGKVNISCSEYIPVIEISGSENITIKNIHGYHNVKNVQMSCGPGATIITADNSRGINIQNCELNGCGEVGFQGFMSNNINITGNYIHSNISSAMSFSIDSEIVSNLKIVIRNNQIVNNNGPVIPSYKYNRYYFKDTIDVKGFVMLDNKMDKNDNYKKQSYIIKGQKILFKEPVYQNTENKESPVYSGTLAEDSQIKVGNLSVTFMAFNEISFYPNGCVQSGVLANEKKIKVEGKTYTILKGTFAQYYDNGQLMTIETSDNYFLNFDEKGGLVQHD